MAPVMRDRFTLDIETDEKCTQSFPVLVVFFLYFPYSSLYSLSRMDVHFINMWINLVLAVEVIY